ncbi:MAG TPA: hypothetical protein VKA85_05320, partial [Candidatus Limnocylindrales bacterium]|nr:hypothetical protein [Candidatus Limnocylindrales bacterium]
MLAAAGWETAAEATFSVYGERGSVDVLAFHAATSALLVVEVKTVVPDMGSMLIALDRKRRLARRIAADRGWRAATVARVLVMPDNTTTRRRAAAVKATFAAEFPARSVEVRRWIAAPRGAISGIWFLPDALHVRTRRRLAPRCPSSTHERPGHFRHTRPLNERRRILASRAPGAHLAKRPARRTGRLAGVEWNDRSTLNPRGAVQNSVENPWTTATERWTATPPNV